MEHPTDEQRLRFARIEASTAENREIVRHLLRGCPLCGNKIRADIYPQIPEAAYEEPLNRLERASQKMTSPAKAQARELRRHRHA